MRVTRDAMIREFASRQILAVLADKRAHESYAVTQVIRPSVLAYMLELGEKGMPTTAQDYSLTAIAQRHCSTAVRNMVSEGKLRQTGLKMIKGVPCRIVQLPGAPITTTVTGAFQWRETLDAFQRQARAYLDARQFDKMGLT